MPSPAVRKLLVLLAALALIGAACGEDAAETGTEDAPADGEEEPAAPDEEEAAAPDEDILIGVSLASPTIPLYVAMEEGISERAEELGVDVVFTDADEDVEAQLNDAQDLIVQGVDAILISPIDEQAAIPVYEDAAAQGIPIVSIARNVDPEYEDTFVGARWEEYGRTIAEWTCEETGGEGTIAMIKGPAGASFVEDMDTGYQDYMANECPDMEIVFETNVSPLTADAALPAAQDALSANPDVDVMYGNNDELAEGIIRALEELGNPEDVIVTGFDGNETGLDNLEEGSMDMTIALRPWHWGQLGLETVVGVVQGEEYPEVVEIETIVLDQENLDDYDRDELR